ncbi:hypothetical protein GCM10010347_46470 [Streptomyces cirratus]|uniref:Secreted protein n=1 Tax=Streptomyces cirratus TaxID=68187 RepID=A0ABQ3F1C6_9ACTN|nr:hypothetical protein GCM10010347_46470 [Streptomyces cirratus]
MRAPIRPPILVTVTGVVAVAGAVAVVMGAPWRCVRVLLRSGGDTGTGKVPVWGSGDDGTRRSGRAWGTASQAGADVAAGGGAQAGRRRSAAALRCGGAQARRGAGQRP